MRLAEMMTAERVRKAVPALALYAMLGVIVGYLFFMTAYPYYCAPIDTGMPIWLFALAILGLGLLAGYLYPDINHVLASSLLVPLAGAVFFAFIFTSPTLLQDIVYAGVDDAILEAARAVLAHVAMTFLIILGSGVVAMYFFEGADA